MKRASRVNTRVVAPVMEVFASIQGEAAFAGEPQVFVRLRGCPLRCAWCDTPDSWRVSREDRARIVSSAARESSPAAPDVFAERAPAPLARDRSEDARRGERSRSEDPWATPFQVACWVAEVEPGSPRTVSVTGGEPLVWPEFLLGLKPMLGERRIHLETAGAHPQTLARVIDQFDHISLDLKPELDLEAPDELGAAETSAHGSTLSTEAAPRTTAEWSAARRACLALVRDRDACGKIVISGRRKAQDFEPLLDEVELCAPRLSVYLQPATPVNGVPAPSREMLAIVVEMARDRGLSVRVLPQIHRALRMR